MRTNIVIDDKLMDTVMKTGRFRTSAPPWRRDSGS